MNGKQSGTALLAWTLVAVAILSYALGQDGLPASGSVALSVPPAAPKPGRNTAGLDSPQTEPLPPEVPLRRARHEVRPGEPLDGALRQLDLAPAERRATVGALEGHVDLRRILPGEQVEVARTEGGRLREVTLQRDALESVRVRFPEGEAPSVETLRREPEIHLRRIDGRIQESLYDAVLEAGGDANLTMRFADLLGWQVDFLTEPRPGDRFRIVAREKYLDGKRLGFGKLLTAEYTGARASATALRYVDSRGQLDWYSNDGRSVRRAFLKSPLSYRRISSHFSAHRKHPILKTVRPHWGVDYAAPVGTPVSALGDGVVEFAGRNGGYGNCLEVRHNRTYTTCYGHLSRFARGIERGSRVAQGEVIGFVGSTGLSTGPHLDFRVKKNGRFVDPLRLDSPPGRALKNDAMGRFVRYRDRAWELVDRLGVGESVAESSAWGRVGPAAPAETIMAWNDRESLERLSASH